MNDELKTQVSAFIDGELPAAEAELLTRRLGRDPQLRQQAAEYLRIGRLLRGERSVPGCAGLAGRIAAALDGEEPLAGDDTANTAGGNWLRPAAGVAVAASVALLALAGIRQVDIGSPDNGAAPGAAQLAGNAAGAYTQPLAIDVMADRPGEMLMQYYLSHGETSGELGANGILSRLVTLELRGGELVEVAPVDDAELESPAAEDDNSATDSAQDQ